MKTILVCNDLSDNAHQALIRAVSLAAHSHASLIVLHAAATNDDSSGEIYDALLASARSEAEAIGAAALDVHALVVAREPKKAILEEIERSGADLVILGGHGRPRFRDAIFGTTGTHIVRHSNVPILIVQTEATLPYAKLMVAVDSQENAARLVESSAAIAPAGEVFTVHAFHANVADLIDDEVLDDLAAREVRALQAALAGVIAAHPGAMLGAHRHVIAEPGDAMSVIMDETERLVPDLVVMGTRHHASFLGSHAVDACFWCPADLLIVPEMAPVLADA